MTKREKEIYDILKKNPMLGQEAIAEDLGITRTSVAVHISNLIKKGYIIGKGYLMAEENSVIVIGGANVDIQGAPYDRLLPHDSNPGTITMSLGGVGRNIAENLSLMGASVRLITAVGLDREGDMIRENAVTRGIRLDDSLILDQRTSTYMYILDEKGDMSVAISDMDITKNLTPEFLRSKASLLNQSEYIVVDANLEAETIEYLTTLEGPKLILDPVSTTKAIRAKAVMGHFYAVKLNKLEAEMLLGYGLDSQTSLKKACKELRSLGVWKVFITLGEGGVFFDDGKEQKLIESKAIDIVNVTGAGDAFTAGLVYGMIQGMTTSEMIETALSAAAQTLGSKSTVYEGMRI